MHKAHHRNCNLERIYLPRKESGRSLLSVEDTINTFIFALEENFVHSDGRILSAARNIEGIT